METVSFILSIVAIILAFFAIWQANHHRDQSDKLNRDTTEKLARIEASATSTKEDAFAEIRRWGDFARAGAKASEEVEKVKEEELKKLKEELRNMASDQINKVLQTVEGRLSATAETSDISEIRKEFEELKREIAKIQEKGLGEARKLDLKRKFSDYWSVLTEPERDFLRRLSVTQIISPQALDKVGLSSEDEIDFFLHELDKHDVITGVGFIKSAFEDKITKYLLQLTPEFEEFLRMLKKDEMV